MFAERPTGFEWVYPFVANTTLSIELYLKSCIAEDDWIPCHTSEEGVTVYIHFTKCLSREHNLKDLYKRIPENIKSLLEAEFRNSELISSYPSLEKAFSTFSNSFVEARYPYEKGNFKGYCITDLVNLSKFLKGAISRFGEING